MNGDGHFPRATHPPLWVHFRESGTESAKIWLHGRRACHTRYGMKMTLHIDEALLDRVTAIYGCESKTAAVAKRGISNIFGWRWPVGQFEGLRFPRFSVVLRAAQGEGSVPVLKSENPEAINITLFFIAISACRISAGAIFHSYFRTGFPIQHDPA